MTARDLCAITLIAIAVLLVAGVLLYGAHH